MSEKEKKVIKRSRIADCPKVRKTFSLDREVFEDFRGLAARSGKSVSGMVNDYMRSVLDGKKGAE